MHGAIDELILGGHIIYIRDKIEFLSEADHVRHKRQNERTDVITAGDSMLRQVIKLAQSNPMFAMTTWMSLKAIHTTQFKM